MPRGGRAVGPERVAKLEVITIDMSGAYIKAVTELKPVALRPGSTTKPL